VPFAAFPSLRKARDQLESGTTIGKIVLEGV
jgi:hypothetical protein